jgi:hypothetical protein
MSLLPQIRKYVPDDTNNLRLRKYLNESSIRFEDFVDSIRVGFHDNQSIQGFSKYINTELSQIVFGIKNSDEVAESIFEEKPELLDSICFKPKVCLIVIVETYALYQRLGLANKMFKLLFETFEESCHFCLDIDAFAMVDFDVVNAFYESLGFDNYELSDFPNYRWRI